jgi:hypothetical protein
MDRAGPILLLAAIAVATELWPTPAGFDRSSSESLGK